MTTKSYHGIAGHFFDGKWILQSLVTDFLLSHGNNKRADIAILSLRVVLKCDLENKCKE